MRQKKRFAFELPFSFFGERVVNLAPQIFPVFFPFFAAVNDDRRE
jgi:hypothetical protein